MYKWSLIKESLVINVGEERGPEDHASVDHDHVELDRDYGEVSEVDEWPAAPVDHQSRPQLVLDDLEALISRLSFKETHDHEINRCKEWSPN